jgi:hypothetical protein
MLQRSVSDALTWITTQSTLFVRANIKFDVAFCYSCLAGIHPSTGLVYTYVTSISRQFRNSCLAVITQEQIWRGDRTAWYKSKVTSGILSRPLMQDDQYMKGDSKDTHCYQFYWQKITVKVSYVGTTSQNYQVLHNPKRYHQILRTWIFWQQSHTHA